MALDSTKLQDMVKALQAASTALLDASKALEASLAVVPAPTPTPVPVPMVLSLSVPAKATEGDTIKATLTVSGVVGSLSTVKIAGRFNGASHANGPYTDFSPTFTAVTNGVYEGSLTLPASGSLEAYATYQDAQGVWHDQPSFVVSVAAKVVPVPTPVPTPIPAPTTSAFQLGAQGWFLAPGWAHGSPFVAAPNFATWQTVPVWKPEFLADMKNFAAYRFMDWAATNHSKVTKWSERMLPASAANGTSRYIDASTTAVTPGMAYELMFDLAQRVGLKTVWICLPALADDDYFTQFAKLAKAMLPAGSQLIVELSNEIDGGWFSQTAGVISAGVAGKLPGSNQWYQGAAYATLRTLAISKALRLEFGAEHGIRSKVVRCMVGNTDLCKQSLTSVYKSAQWNPTNEVIHALGHQMYWSAKQDGANLPLATQKADIDTSTQYCVETRAMANSVGIKETYIYEFNCHVLLNAGIAAGTQDSADALKYALDVAKKNVSVACLYTDASSWSNKQSEGAWGLKQTIGGVETLKWKAMREWVAANK